MKGAALITVVAALGMRHGVDPDHLSIIDGLSRFHPSRWNGVLFAAGHGIIVTVLAVGFGKLLAGFIEPYTVWILVALGAANLWRLLRPKAHVHPKPPGLFRASPLLLGVLFGMGFETASQLSAILLAGQLNPGSWAWSSRWVWCWSMGRTGFSPPGRSDLHERVTSALSSLPERLERWWSSSPSAWLA